SSRRRHTILVSDWSSDVCSSDLAFIVGSTVAQAQTNPPPSSTSTTTNTTIVYDNNPNWGLSSAGLTPGPYGKLGLGGSFAGDSQIGRASCREGEGMTSE